MRVWGRSDAVAWGSRPPAVPMGVLLVVALLGAVTTAAYGYRAVWSPLQRHYLGAYVRSAVAFSSRGEYDLWQVVNRTGARLALDEDLVSVTTATGETSFALAAPAATAGATRLASTRQTYAHAALHAFLRRWIYRDQTVLDLLLPALWSALALFLGGVIGARAQAVVDARWWRAPSPTWSASGPPVVIESVNGVPGVSALRPATERLPSLSRPALSPGPAPSTRPPAGADVPARPAVQPSSPASWPGPLFQ